MPYKIGDPAPRKHVDLKGWSDETIKQVVFVMDNNHLNTAEMGMDGDIALYIEFGRITDELQTRYIRSMSDEELAHAINLLHDQAVLGDLWEGDDQQYWDKLYAEQLRRTHAAINTAADVALGIGEQLPVDLTNWKTETLMGMIASIGWSRLPFVRIEEGTITLKAIERELQRRTNSHL